MEDALPTEVDEEVQSLSEMYEEEYDVLNKIYSGDMADVESSPKYMPKKTMDDPIVKALAEKLGVGEVIKIELLESRWNGNDCYKYVTDKGPFFVKVNRVEDVSVFTAEALGLVTIARTNSTRVPRPYHVGPLPRVGEFGPGAFLVMEYMTLKPFGSQISTNQTALGQQLAAMHLSTELANVHQGRFGFVVNNWLAISPQNNTWTSSWPVFFHRRLDQQIQRAYQVRDFSETGVAPTTDPELQEKGRRLLDLVPRILAGVEVTPSLVHGDLWIGNTGADQHGPVLFDPAVYFGHHEVELGILDMYGGYSQRFYDAYHDAIPRADGFDTRHTLYQLYHYLNILNLFGDPQVNDKCIELMTALLS